MQGVMVAYAVFAALVIFIVVMVAVGALVAAVYRRLRRPAGRP